MKYLVTLVLGTTLLTTATATTAQEMPPRQIGSLDVNALTTAPLWTIRTAEIDANPTEIDRKSTRLNSGHTVISYAVFCLKKKKK